MRLRGLRLLARRRAMTIVTHLDPIAGFGLIPIVTPQAHAIWDLRPGPDLLRAGLGGKWRNQLGAAERAGIRVRAGTAETMEKLISAEAVQRRFRGYRALPSDFALAMKPEDLSLWQWMSGGRMQAAMCFIRHGTAASYLMGWLDPDARGRNCHNMMLFSAALALRAQGVQWLDLGTVNTDDTPGLARFKLGTGAKLHQAGATCLVLPF
jgi:lipid II:glycine glycyltransferase (peptidoglycan interpeptide bridge formation enzyme)